MRLQRDKRSGALPELVRGSQGPWLRQGRDEHCPTGVPHRTPQTGPLTCLSVPVHTWSSGGQGALRLPHPHLEQEGCAEGVKGALCSSDPSVPGSDEGMPQGLADLDSHSLDMAPMVLTHGGAGPQEVR